MARYYGEIFGSARTVASRLGRGDIAAHVRGWNVGIRVTGRPCAESDRDVFHVYATSGSHGASSDVYIGRVMLDDDGRPTFYASKEDNE